MDFLTLFISLRCTHTCAHCLYACSPARGEHMSLEVFRRSIAIAQEDRIPALNFFGGEPSLNPSFYQMLQEALERDFFLILATNCRPLAKEDRLIEFLETTRAHRKRMRIVTSRDRFHLRFFDPADVASRLRDEGYEVVVNDYSDSTVLLSEYNASNPELRKLDTGFSCCKGNWMDYLGVLPDGGWTICPPSLEPFGNVFSEGLPEIINFKRGLSLHYAEGCTGCLKDFRSFRRKFEAARASLRSRP